MTQSPTIARRLGRLLIFFVVTLTGAVLCVSAGFGALNIVVLTHVPCSGHSRTPDDYNTDYNWERVTIPAGDDNQIDAILVHGDNGATIIYPPTLGDSVSGRLDEALPLVDAGYTTLTFESRRCAEMGPISLGYNEVTDVKAALDYLNTRPDIDPNRIGIDGFSSSGATAIMAAVQYPQLRAVVASGNYADMHAILAAPQQTALPFLLDLYRFGMRGTYWVITGNSIRTLSPLTHIDDIAPRRILLIYGTEEASLAGGRELRARAGDNAELWVIEGADHGGYVRIMGDAYFARVQTFFDEHLLNG
jgi:uncharacterized protein